MSVWKKENDTCTTSWEGGVLPEKGMLFAAKSNVDGLWESLSQHHYDTAGVIKCLSSYDSGWVSPSFIRAAGMEPGMFKNVCVFIAALHDIGKQTPVFQCMISKALDGLEERLLKNGFDISPGAKSERCYHAFISGVILHEYFGVRKEVCDIIAAHHGSPRPDGPSFRWDSAFKYNKTAIEGISGEFRESWEETVRFAENLSGLKCGSLPEISLAGQILLSHMLIIADWISSNEEYFPLVKPWDAPSPSNNKRFQHGYEKSGVKRGWFPQTYAFDKDIFKERFGFAPNAMQEAAGTAAGNGGSLIIIEAPMGMGKTEASLMCAELMSSARAAGGLFIGLPTQATANGLFPRMLSWARKASPRLPVTVGLAHGSAFFNENYHSLFVNANDEYDNLTVNRWMNGRHRKLMSDFVDGTADQALSMALNRKYFMLLHGSLAGKAVIFDEIHSYDAYTDAYIGTTLAYLGLYGCPVVLLSATLTDAKKADFIHAYMQDRKSTAPIPKAGGYPSITWYDGKEIKTEVIPQDGIKKTDFSIRWLDDTELADTIKQKLSKGGCAGVIRNTVKEAFHTYQSLKKILPGFRIMLVHSRFLSNDRASNEKELLKHIGKKSTPEDRNGLIVVGTQVLEQSLDIDFDIMFTDPCPMDLFLQRIGREHRHKRTRPEQLASAEIYLLMSGNRIVGDKGKPYDSCIMKRTVKILKDKDTLALPSDIKHLVEETYDISLIEESEEKQEYLNKIASLRSSSKNWRIPDPWDASSIRKYCKGNDEAEEEGVRKGNNSFSVLMLKKEGEYITDIAGTAYCRTGCTPDAETEDIFLRQTISIPYYMLSKDELEKMKARTGFGDIKPWKYKDILLLDEDFSYMHTEGKRSVTYRYGKKTGLTESQ